MNQINVVFWTFYASNNLEMYHCFHKTIKQNNCFNIDNRRNVTWVLFKLLSDTEAWSKCRFAITVIIFVGLIFYLKYIQTKKTVIWHFKIIIFHSNMFCCIWPQKCSLGEHRRTLWQNIKKHIPNPTFEPLYKEEENRRNEERKRREEKRR